VNPPYSDCPTASSAARPVIPDLHCGDLPIAHREDVGQLGGGRGSARPCPGTIPGDDEDATPEVVDLVDLA
jgi:hypothetical protein